MNELLAMWLPDLAFHKSISGTRGEAWTRVKGIDTHRGCRAEGAGIETHARYLLHHEHGAQRVVHKVSFPAPDLRGFLLPNRSQVSGSHGLVIEPVSDCWIAALIYLGQEDLATGLKRTSP